MSKSAELQFIEERISRKPPSKDLLEMRESVKEHIPVENIIEFFIPKQEYQELKDSILKEAGAGNSYFFSKEDNGILSVICFYNVIGIKEVFDKEKEKRGLDKNAEMSFSEFNAATLETSAKKSKSSGDQPFSFLD